MRHAGVESVEHEKQLYDRLGELSRILKIPIIEPFLRVSKIDRDGEREKIIDRHCRSYTRNMYNVHVSSFCRATTGVTYADGSLYCKQTSGTLTSPLNWAGGTRNLENGDYGYIDLAGALSHGIIIGTGITAESFDDYKIETIINNGVGGGQMEYSTMVSARTEGWVGGGPYYYHNFERVMSNNSGGSITVTESALYWKGFLQIFCSIRDKFSSGIAVADGEAIAVEYELRQAYP